MNILIINGPNLNLIGTREQSVYGSETIESFIDTLKIKYNTINLSYYQSNVEGELINKLHQSRKDYKGIILNAGGYTHTSIALADAVAAIDTDVIEVHISNVFKREDYRHVSYIGKNCIGSISGFGLQSYELALLHFIQQG